jgi:hypothetical protein
VNREWNTLSSSPNYRIMPRPRLFLITFMLLVAATIAACSIVPKKSLTDVDFPATAGTTYASFQNQIGQPAEVSFTSDGPWDFSQGPKSVTVKSVLVKKTDAAGQSQFGEATYAEKVMPSKFTNGYTTYNFASITKASLNSYGQSSTPGPNGPIVKTYDRPERLLKFPVRLGDSWTDTITTAEEDPVVIELKREVIARGQVKVPAGSFFNCFMIRLTKIAKAKDDTQATRTIMYFWWAPEVGLVAAVGSQPDEAKMYFSQADYIFRLNSYEVKD